MQINRNFITHIQTQLHTITLRLSCQMKCCLFASVSAKKALVVGTSSLYAQQQQGQQEQPA